MLPDRRALLLAGYLLAGALAAAEVTILMLALNPQVGSDYRAFYVDRTTTCLNRDAAGTYQLGQTVSFLRDGRKEANNIKVCGWTGPAGDGTHSLGETSRLRINAENLRTGLLATLEMSAVIRPPVTEQRVLVSINGVQVDRLVLTSTAPRTVTFMVPPVALGGGKTIEIVFDYLDGIPPNRSASAIYKRAIKLVSFRLDELGNGPAPIDRSSGQQTPSGPSRRN